MQVSELITAVSKFAFGRKNPTESDRADYLFLLNLADCEYHACAKNSNLLRFESDLFFDAATNFTDVPDNYIHAIYSNKIKLKEEKEDISLTKEGTYYYLNGQVFINKIGLQYKIDPFDGVSKQYVTLLAQPNRKKLVELVTDVATQLNTPIYPEQYHLGLVHGAVYYLSQTHEGFATKMDSAMYNWKLAKDNLMSYYVKGV